MPAPSSPPRRPPLAYNGSARDLATDVLGLLDGDELGRFVEVLLANDRAALVARMVFCPRRCGRL